ncbi:MAG: indolepyruvate ferredoxin oxidoreductase subunit alpha [Desulfovibrio sp.]|jgi:indolepyruvate ferredoxin oxidoreductase alpha subunit|nr:indolepyruvate ferredoxin oxidoreductase subunit alpha [Desulfovibrio sp.]
MSAVSSPDHPLLGLPGERRLLLGNEAIVRGALEAGVHLIACYPGTPSSEVPDAFYSMRGQGRFRMEYSVNEKVALEVAAGAALAGAMSLATMKHVGVNVAADPLLTSAYIGLPGGLVLLSADDPGCHSSQNEQDNRHYARFASLPCFEPASAQEAKDMTRAAFRLARELQQPVMLRVTTRVAHMRGPVEFGALPQTSPLVEFQRDPGRFVPVPAVALKRHKALAAALEQAARLAETSPFTRCRAATRPSRLGIIASGVARAYLADALTEGGWEDSVHILELGVTWPLPVEALGAFLSGCDRVLVLEEGAPLLENDLRALAQRRGLAALVEGKDADLTEQGEYSTSRVLRRVSSFLDCPRAVAPARGPLRAVRSDLPARAPNLCPGCSHRAVYYAARQVYGDAPVYSSDIGCYTLGMAPPLRMADFLVCMGSSVSAGSGFAAVSDRPVVAFIGDSTFFHSGMTGLANAVFNRHNLLLVILDNGTTAMTGHQPNPGMLQEDLGEAARHLDIEGVVRALGVTECARVGAFNLKALLGAFADMKEKSGVRVLIAEELCALYARRRRKTARRTVVVARQGDEARRCLERLACPAFCRDGDDVAVDQTLCVGCMVCLQAAPGVFKAVSHRQG